MSTWMTWTYAAAVLASVTANAVALSWINYTEHSKAPQSSALCLSRDEDVACGLKCQICTNAAFAIALVLVAVSMSTIDTTDESSRCRKEASQRCDHLKLAMSIFCSVYALLLTIASIGHVLPAREVDTKPRTPESTPKCIGFSSPQLPTKTIPHSGFKVGAAATLSILFLLIAVDLLLLDAFPNDHKNVHAHDGYFLLCAIILFLIASILLAGQVVVLISEVRAAEMEPLARHPQLSTTAV
ncbi:hypothetical protein AC1031_017720 [Aphanomyces cochlioides]|nr:hypothetical protein AC1031_017720 [Aphanomyces cochlioides]